MRDYDNTTYGERIAPVYDTAAWMAESPDDAVAFLAPLADGGTALELGIGSGRVALPLAGKGITVTGVDSSPAMLDLLRARSGDQAVTALEGDLAEAGPPAQYDLVFCVYNTLYLLNDQQEQIRCLRNAAERLRPGGHLVVEASVMPPSRLAERRFLNVLGVETDEVVLLVSQHDPVTQRIVRQDVVLREGRTELYPMCYRYVWPAELDVMADLAGLAPIGRYGGWNGESFTGTGRHVSQYRKRAA